VWGYSAYVTDPDGYHWKIASSKRRPLIGRKGTSSSGNAPEIKPKEIPITIGVADMRRSKEFYEHGLGLPVKKSYGTKFVMFGGEGDTSDLGMYKREALADDAAVQPDGSGFHGFKLTYVADSAEQVDQLLARVNQAGARILTWPSSASDVYSGHFADFDGNVWQIVSDN
jgi:predicted lactoylglutathione lyase